MKKHVLQSCICLLLLVSLAAAPALAATLSSTVTCPSTCSCLLPADAKKLGYPGYCGGKQQACGSDGLQNVKYCYTRPVTTTTIVPQLIITAHRFVTTTPTTAPLEKCASGCECISTAEGNARGYEFCSGRQVFCGYGSDKTPQFCYANPAGRLVTGVARVTIAPVTKVTTTTTLPVARVRTEPCTGGCSCLATDKADAAGLKRCSGTSAPCSYDPAGRPMYCYVADRVTMVNPVPAGTTGTAARPATGTVAPVIRLPLTSAVPAPTQQQDAFSPVGLFFATLFGGTPSPASPSPGPSGYHMACLFGQTECDGACVDLQTDEFNCGACRGYCSAGWGETCCGGSCARTLQDPANCGACGNACPAGQWCSNGTCTAGGCSAGLSDCGGFSCTDTQSDPANCGACGNACLESQDCFNGACRTCPAGSERCNGRCTNTQTFPYACGGCGNVCAPDEICTGGSCRSCPAGTTRCGNSCADLQSDETYCGSCGTRCSSEKTCCNGQCVNLQYNDTNCGSCGNTCGSGFSCGRGICVYGYGVAECGGGYTNCGGSCVDSESDENNCGGCGIRCGPHETCCEGECADTRQDVWNCGSCGHRCSSTGSTGDPAGPFCRDGQCVPRDIDENCGLSCKNIHWDEDNCGSCGHHCPWNKECQNGVCCLWGTLWGCD